MHCCVEISLSALPYRVNYFENPYQFLVICSRKSNLFLNYVELKYYIIMIRKTFIFIDLLLTKIILTSFSYFHCARQEIARKELENLKEQKETLTSEVQELDRRSERLQDLYKEQDELLDQIFNGAYGSEKENQLENFLDQTEEMRNRIVEANFKWKQAQMMIDYSYKQLEYAVNKWAGLQSISDG